jgi:hypothetical protein
LFLYTQPECFSELPQDRHPERSASRIHANRGPYSAESKDPGDACWQMLFGAFRPETTTEDKKSQTPSEAALSRPVPPCPGSPWGVPWRDLQFRGPLLETPNSVLKQNVHLACPGAPWDRSVPGFPASLHWTRPRMRLSLNERRMMFDNASNFYRKSGVAQWRDLRFLQFSRRL